MKFFIDTANLDEIREAEAMGIISGVTTNPSLIAKEGRDYEETLRKIAQIVDGPISGEVKASTTLARDMVMEGRVISQIHPNMVVKIPMTQEGLKAVKILASEGIKTNVTLVFSATQAILAARAGATYVSPLPGAAGRHFHRRHPADQGSDGDLPSLPGHHHQGDLRLHPASHACGGMCQNGSGYCHGALQGADADGPASPHPDGHREVLSGFRSGVRPVNYEQPVNSVTDHSVKTCILPLLWYNKCKCYD